MIYLVTSDGGGGTPAVLAGHVANIATRSIPGSTAPTQASPTRIARVRECPIGWENPIADAWLRRAAFVRLTAPGAAKGTMPVSGRRALSVYRPEPSREGGPRTSPHSGSRGIQTHTEPRHRLRPEAER